MYIFVFLGSSTCVIIFALAECFLLRFPVISLVPLHAFFVFLVGILSKRERSAPRVPPYITRLDQTRDASLEH